MLQKVWLQKEFCHLPNGMQVQQNVLLASCVRFELANDLFCSLQLSPDPDDYDSIKEIDLSTNVIGVWVACLRGLCSCRTVSHPPSASRW